HSILLQKLKVYHQQMFFPLLSVKIKQVMFGLASILPGLRVMTPNASPSSTAMMGHLEVGYSPSIAIAVADCGCRVGRMVLVASTIQRLHIRHSSITQWLKACPAIR